jgi:DNA modification methylase
MGSGSTIAAASACGFQSLGIELNRDYFRLATKAVPQLAALSIDSTRNGNRNGNRSADRRSD